MAYSPDDIAKLIVQNQQTNPGLAYAIFNGASGMGGGMGTGFSAGAVDVALRNLMGPDAAKNWINAGSNQYGNAMMDPTTGQYGYYENGALKSGTVAGFDPSQFNTNMQMGAVNYDPTQTASNLPGPTGIGLRSDQWMRSNPDGTYSGVQYGAVPPGGYGNQHPGPAPAPPPTGGTPAATTPAPRATTLSALAGTGASPPTGTAPATPASTAGATVGGYTGGGSAPGGTNGASGSELPTANAAPYTSPTFTRPESATTPMDFLNDPGYKWELQQITDATNNSAAARGNLNSGATAKALQDRAAGLASQTYGDAFNRNMQSKNFAENQYNSDRNFGQSSAIDARNFNNNNRMWDTTFNNSNRIDARNFDNSNNQWGMTFDNNNRLADRNFDYTAQTGDRNFNAQTLQSLAGMGLNASSNNAQIAAILAKIFGENTMTGAGAGAAGGVGNAQNWLDLIGQFNKYLTSPTVPATTTTPH